MNLIHNKIISYMRRLQTGNNMPVFYVSFLRISKSNTSYGGDKDNPLKN